MLARRCLHSIQRTRSNDDGHGRGFESPRLRYDDRVSGAGSTAVGLTCSAALS